MLISISGLLGAGKSATLAKLAFHYHSYCSECGGVIPELYKDYIQDTDTEVPFKFCECKEPKPTKIHANFNLKGIDYNYVSCTEDISKIHNGYSFFDEFWDWDDSRGSSFNKTNATLNGFLLNSRKRKYHILYETKMIGMTDKRIREMSQFALLPEKYIEIEGDAVKVEEDMLHPIDLSAWIDKTWFEVHKYGVFGEQLVDLRQSFWFKLSDVKDKYDTNEEIVSIVDGEQRPGLEKGMKIQDHFETALRDAGISGEILQGRWSRGWDVVVKNNGSSAAYDVVSVNKPTKGSKWPWIDLRGKHINELLKTAYKQSLKPFWAYKHEGKWWTIPMLESHAIRSTLTCRDAKELKPCRQ